MELQFIKKAYSKIISWQLLISFNSEGVVHDILNKFEQALHKIQSLNGTEANNHKSILMELKAYLDQYDPCNRLMMYKKDLDKGLTEYYGSLKCLFHTDLSEAFRDTDFDHHMVNQIIVSHLYHHGQFKVAECFVNEIGATYYAVLRDEFRNMHSIVAAMRERHDIQTALSWIDMKRDELGQSAVDLELKLHQMIYFKVLKSGSNADALEYLKTWISPLLPHHRNEVHKLACCLLWKDKIDECPYPGLMDPRNWDNLAEKFALKYCNLLGELYESKLSQVVSAGLEGMSSVFMHLGSSASKNGSSVEDGEGSENGSSVEDGEGSENGSSEDSEGSENGSSAEDREGSENGSSASENGSSSEDGEFILVDLVEELMLHSVFICPLLSVVATEENPPMQLPCGHVFCKRSVIPLTEYPKQLLKCPICSDETTAEECRRLYF
ncbi:CTLH/CRA C-terminal to LisH motif domain [Dillenia turbinata]|uniref:CTLH/CRA C-terminal to LisH motif domain n=1 Tax=Dillenia turbinata TaxID=194707 RepID=A0AAN8WG24_9MAGN